MIKLSFCLYQGCMISSWTLHIVKAIDYKLVKRFHDLTPLLIPNI